MIGFLSLLIFIHIGDKAGAFNTFGFLDDFRQYVSIGTMIGRTPTLTVAGVIVGMLFMTDSPAQTPSKRIFWILAFAGGLFMAGFLLRPAYGLGKGGGAITGRLYCAVICCVVYALLYWLTDVQGIRRWSHFTLPAARNPLLPYFLSFTVYPLLVVLHLDWLNGYWNTGIVGIGRSMCFTVILVVVITALLSRLHVRLKL